MPTSKPEIGALLSWSKEFEAGLINDPGLLDGTLAPDEHVAVRAGPVTSVDLEVQRDGPLVIGTGMTGSMLATDRRVLLLGTDAETTAWAWDTDVEQVTPLRNFLGVMWSPSAARYQSGARLQGLVLPSFAHGGEARTDPDSETRALWIKVQVAWRASQPGGVAAWRTEFRQRYGG